MNTKSNQLADRYLAALRTHLEQGPQASLAPADKLGKQALRMGLEAMDLVMIHELALLALLSLGYSPGDGDGTIVRTGIFFRQALTPLISPSGDARQVKIQKKPAHGKPQPRTADLAVVIQQLKRETARRQTAETALRKSQEHYGALLTQSHLMQGQLRHLSHQILLAQEEERKHISRELHDEISQILTGINVRLAALKVEATANTGSLKKQIVYTQRLVAKSVAAVHRFARELRPAMLDDLGLIPALVTFMKEFGKRTGLRIHFTSATAGKIDQLNSLKRTALYRVAQEALTNIAKHALASLVKVSLEISHDTLCLTINDNGKSFDVDGLLSAKRQRRLGILGMRERMEMVGGAFAIESVPGNGTTVRVQVALRNGIKENHSTSTQGHV